MTDTPQMLVAANSGQTVTLKPLGREGEYFLVTFYPKSNAISLKKSVVGVGRLVTTDGFITFQSKHMPKWPAHGRVQLTAIPGDNDDVDEYIFNLPSVLPAPRPVINRRPKVQVVPPAEEMVTGNTALVIEAKQPCVCDGETIQVTNPVTVPGFLKPPAQLFDATQILREAVQKVNQLVGLSNETVSLEITLDGRLRATIKLD